MTFVEVTIGPGRRASRAQGSCPSSKGSTSGGSTTNNGMGNRELTSIASSLLKVCECERGQVGSYCVKWLWMAEIGEWSYFSSNVCDPDCGVQSSHTPLRKGMFQGDIATRSCGGIWTYRTF